MKLFRFEYQGHLLSFCYVFFSSFSLKKNYPQFWNSLSCFLIRNRIQIHFCPVDMIYNIIKVESRPILVRNLLTLFFTWHQKDHYNLVYLRQRRDLYFVNLSFSDIFHHDLKQICVVFFSRFRFTYWCIKFKMKSYVHHWSLLGKWKKYGKVFNQIFKEHSTVGEAYRRKESILYCIRLWPSIQAAHYSLTLKNSFET